MLNIELVIGSYTSHLPPATSLLPIAVDLIVTGGKRLSPLYVNSVPTIKEPHFVVKTLVKCFDLIK